MDTHSYSNISLDSLELESRKKSSQKENLPAEIVDTILVPFYENDVLIKIPKGNKKNRLMVNKVPKLDINTFEGQSKSYLMNNNLQRNKKTSYLQMFRKQFSTTSNYHGNMKTDPNEIRSISPEFGDTERESFGEEYNSNEVSEFYNTEAYNEMYYNKIMNQELEQYANQFIEDGLNFDEEIRSKSPTDLDNLRSVSEVSRPRHDRRRTTIPINNNVQLGGLGPDMDNIKPRLERAKSLQRYSEKVRMENKLKIYKKEMDAQKEKKAGKHTFLKRNSASRNAEQKVEKSSYLIDKISQKKSSVMTKIYTKSKFLDVNERDNKQQQKVHDNKPKNDMNIEHKESKPNRVIGERKLQSAKNNLQNFIKAGYDTTRNMSSHGTRQKQTIAVPPVEISFTVNVGGVRPSTALESLEEKHRIYQEKVKGYAMDANNT